MVASAGDRRFSSEKRGGAFRPPCLKCRGVYTKFKTLSGFVSGTGPFSSELRVFNSDFWSGMRGYSRYCQISTFITYTTYLNSFMKDCIKKQNVGFFGCPRFRRQRTFCAPKKMSYDLSRDKRILDQPFNKKWKQPPREPY